MVPRRQRERLGRERRHSRLVHVRRTRTIVSDWFVYTTMLWALVMGWSGARVVYYLLSRREYRQRGRRSAARKAWRENPNNWSV
jgi:prolipoprotein diacylglyceryltransferase